MTGAVARWWRAGPMLAVVAVLALPVASPAQEAGVDGGQVDVLYERGARALRQGDVDEALEQLGRAYDLNPNDASVVSLYAKALISAGRSEEAEKLLAQFTPEPGAEGDRDLMLGMAAFQRGNHSAAQEHLSAAVRNEPRSAAAHLYLGATYAELGQEDAAERRLDTAEALDPSLAAHVEYRRGRAALKSGDRPRAEGHFRETMRLAPGSLVARAAQRELQVAPSARPWSLYASFGGAFDTNVNLIGDDDISLTSEEDDVKAFAEVGFDYVLISSDRFHLKAGTSVYTERHADEYDFDIFDGTVWTAASYQLLEDVTADVRYTYEYILADYTRFRRTHAVEPSLRIRVAPGWLTRPYFSFEDREYWDSLSGAPALAFDRDGQVYSFGAEQYYFFPDFTGWGSGFVRIGYRHRRETTDGNEFDSTGYRGNFLLGFPLPFEVFLLGVGSYEKRHYENNSIFKPTGRRRRDWISEGRVILRRPLTPSFTGEVGWHVTRWRSNVSFYDFRRHVIRFLVTYRY